jgi:hypothetical protein
MSVAFNYRRRREQRRFEPGVVGATIRFEEQVEYLLSFPGGCSSAMAHRLTELGGELVGSDTGILGFGNFIGRADLGGVGIEVISSKLGEDGVSRLLQEISELASNLVFGWGSPTGFAVTGDEIYNPPVPYHQLQFLRRMMLSEKPGERLQDWLGTIERNPTRRFEPERPMVSPDRVRRLDHRAVQNIFTRLDRLVPIAPDVAIAGNVLARALTFGTPAKSHFPTEIAAPRGTLSFDTPENRFVKHVLGECLSIVYRFSDNP